MLEEDSAIDQSVSLSESPDDKRKVRTLDRSSLEARQRRPVSLQREAGEKSEIRLRVTTKVAIKGENQS